MCVMLVFLACQTDMSTWQRYENVYYHFALRFPPEYRYCLNVICMNEIPEDAIGGFVLFSELNFQVLNVQPYFNALELSAVEYGQASLDLNRRYHENAEDVYSQEELISFAGQEAYSFLSNGRFEERGGSLSTTEDGHMSLVSDSASYEAPTLDLDLDGVYRVVYVDYGDYIYRILYKDDSSIKEIMETFEFVE